MAADNEEPLGPAVVNVGVISCYSPPTEMPATPPLTDTPLVSLPTSSCSKDDDALLLCFEEVSYQDDSGDDNIKEDNLSSGSQQPPSIVVADPDSSFAQYYGCMSSAPSNSMLFSPNTPWLTSSSPQIASVFATSFSPPMQPLQPQATPKLHHLSPPNSNLTGIYNPFPNSFPNSPLFLPMYNYDESGELHWVPGDTAIQQ